MNIPDAVGYALIQLMREHRGLAEQGLNQIGLYAGQELVLMHLSRNDGASQTELAAAMGVEQPTITKMIQRMERAGLVRREKDAEDSRISRVFMTTEGRGLLTGALEVWKQLETRMLNGMSEVEIALLRRLLAQMTEKLR